MFWNVAAFYRFIALSDLPALQTELKEVCEHRAICGTILLSLEGVNGTLAGQSDDLNEVIDVMDRLLGIRRGELKFSHATAKPFQRLKVRLKKEIITLQAPEADPTHQVGEYIEAQDWNHILNDPGVLVLDTRNAYETSEGTFQGAIDPNIKTFTQFKKFVETNLDPARHEKIAMYCTGGIRCEKASAYLLAHGFKTVYHLKGGILKYLETIPVEQSLWQGTCFVFDKRETLAHQLQEKFDSPSQLEIA